MNFSHLISVALSNVGRKRKSNEDSVLCMSKAGVFCVADGMGGAAGGEMASRWTVEAIQHVFATGAATPQKTVQVRGALNEASRRIKAMADEQGVIGAGTTAVVLFFDDYHPDQATVLHAGDSRAYRIRNGVMECLTLDHSLAASAGLSHDRFLPSMFRGVITRAIGLEDNVELDETVIQVKAGDCFLLCSDGLTKMLSDGDIQNLIHKTSTADLNLLAATLVEEANRAGGEDNISVILVCVGALPAPIPRPAVSGDEADTESKTETADAAVPAPGSDQHEAATMAVIGDDSEHIPETDDVFIGITPQTGHGNTTPSSPAAVQQPGQFHEAHTYPPANTRSGPVNKTQMAAPSGKPPLSASSRSARQSLWILTIILVVLMIVIAVRTSYQRQESTSAVPTEQGVATPAPISGGIPDSVRASEHSAPWTAERNKALQDASYAETALEGYRQAVAALCAQCGLLPPPLAATAPGQAANTPEERADAYCAQLFELQHYLRSQISVFISERSAELNTFGSAPQAVAENIRRFAEAPARIPAYPFEPLQHDLQLLASWLAEDQNRLIPLEEIQSGPPSVLPRILTQRNELWTAILADIEACGPAIEKRQAAGTDDSLLTNIASLQRVIMKTAQASRGRDAAVPWPGRDNLPTLEGFFSRISQYLNIER